jgi:hypothetical protein
MLVSGPLPMRRTVNTWLAAGAAAGLLLLVEVLTWGPGLQAQTLTYFQEAMAYHWFTLPVAEQTPMSNWNRTPLQTLITLGVAAAPAQALALGLWALLTGITVWCVRGRTLTFPLAFALALVLLYWGRPVGWTLVYLEFVVILAVWPALRGWPRWTRWALLGAAGALMLSHWAAFLRTAQGLDMTFLTLQTAALPWETWVVLPLSWALLLSVALWGQHPVPALPAHPLEPQNS